MYLYLNTTERDSFTIALLVGERIVKRRTVKSERKHSEKLLKSIAGMLKQSKTPLSDIKGIAVVQGPGSFTSLRIGIATANALAYGLGIPVSGVAKEQEIAEVVTLFRPRYASRRIAIAVPEYGREPD
ncbi:MAG: tRNA (adenosine(37)-N6)-threonylcarbamoyltransferase complex dimerization subunit type 1 TsaB, partial [Parcubacteria group bacterium]|nr:tRNA (adenosine(37)-N6)-threonylcarbamoyltransferase complex dimerization subunit type 1 TsaB [Parcubacteria group bacterium]